MSSTYGSGHFGSWTVDRFGLPAYRYEIDQTTDPIARNEELSGGTDAWHQVGNDVHHAFASNHGYTQLWSQARAYEWVNRYDARTKHFAGGYGYLNIDGHVLSTLYEDRPAGAVTERDFGIGYFRHATATSDTAVDETVYAPYGSDPVLLHDVSITNRSTAPQRVTWFEYWDVNPAMQPGFPAYGPRPRGLSAPVYDPSTSTVSVDQLPDVTTDDPRSVDTKPLTIFAAALRGDVAGIDTDVNAFFGQGGRAAPAVPAAGHATGSTAPAWPSGETVPGRTLFAMEAAPVTLAPGEHLNLRYAYGTAHAAAVSSLVERYRSASDPLQSSEHAWGSWLPKASFGGAAPWLARELQWDAYNVRSRSTPEEECGDGSTISQGGLYLYDQGVSDAFRDTLQHVMPMIYARPELARDVIKYSAHQQPSVTGAIPYGMQALCSTYYFGGESDDLGLWLMWAAAEYAMATRDLSFLDSLVPYIDGAVAPLWDHLKLAHWHQEHVIGRGLHGLPTGGTMGDWGDFAVVTNGLTESTLVGAQLAFVYPMLAKVATAKGDAAFAAQLTADADAYRAAVGREWVSNGWFTRGYSGSTQIGGNDTMWALTQPWAVLAGIPGQRQTLFENFRHFLTGFGTACGPTDTGSGLLPAPSGPVCAPGTSDPTGLAHDVAAWFAINGPMAWAYGTADEEVPAAARYGWDELLRNTLAALATAHPDHWGGIISADDVCDTRWTPGPYRCGVPQAQTFDTQITHQPAWSMYSLLKLAGVEATEDGYSIAPHLPLEQFSLRLPQVGVALARGLERGYVVPQADGNIEFHVRLPAGVDGAHAVAYVNGSRVRLDRVSGRTVSFGAHGRSGAALDWAVKFPAGQAAPVVPVSDPSAPPPTPAPDPTKANCSAGAGASCDFVADDAPVKGYVATVSATTSFTISDDSVVPPTVVVRATGPGTATVPFVSGHRYTLAVGAGLGEVAAGSVS